MNDLNTVEKTTFSGLCTSCELCFASCSVGAINMLYKGGQFIPDVDTGKCTECGLCLKVCPGIDIKETAIEKIAGDYLEAYSAYTKDTKILNIYKFLEYIFKIPLHDLRL